MIKWNQRFHCTITWWSRGIKGSTLQLPGDQNESTSQLPGDQKESKVPLHNHLVIKRNQKFHCTITWWSKGNSFSSSFSENSPLIRRFSTMNASPLGVKLSSCHFFFVVCSSKFCTMRQGFQYSCKFRFVRCWKKYVLYSKHIQLLPYNLTPSHKPVIGMALHCQMAKIESGGSSIKSFKSSKTCISSIATKDRYMHIGLWNS